MLVLAVENKFFKTPKFTTLFTLSKSASAFRKCLLTIKVLRALSEKKVNAERKNLAEI